MANSNAKRFTSLPIRYFRAIGFEFEEKHLWMKVFLFVGLCNMSLYIVSQVLYVIFADDDFQEKIIAITYLHYFIVCVGKQAALLYNRKAILEVLNTFQSIYPSVRLEEDYGIYVYLRQYLRIQNTLVASFHATLIFFNSYPFLASLMQWIKGYGFERNVPLMYWLPFHIPDNWLTYVFIYCYQLHCNYIVAITILGLDLCLYSFVLQLCLHFDVISRNICQIEPSGSEANEDHLREEIAYHQRILTLADRVNEIFTPSILFSLLSSSCILCFTLYQLLGELSFISILKALLLLTYELKQVIVTCFLADKLMEISTQVGDAVYEHKWYNGSIRYQRLVLIVLMRSQQCVALSAAGITDISLQTLRQVMSMSYQIFTVLRSG